MELTLDQALQKAIEVHRAEQVQEADRLYTAILKAQPQHPDAKAVFGKAKSDGAKGDGFDQLEQRLEGVEPSNITVSQYQDPPEDQKAADKSRQHEPNWHKEQFRVCREIVVAIVAEVQQVERGLILWRGQVKDEAMNIVFCQHLATDACNDQNRQYYRPMGGDECDGDDQNPCHDPDRGMAIHQ